MKTEQVNMQIFILLFLLGIPSVAPATHSLQYFYTASSGIQGFPQFVTVGIVDGQDFIYYDSNIRKKIPRQEWIKENEGPDYWERETQISVGAEQTYKAGVEIIKNYFNQTGGVHIYQRMFGCEWDDETDEVKGFSQFGYDGEDYIVLDLETERWIAPVQQALFTKQKWENNKALIAQKKHYLTTICPDGLKRYVKFGEKSLQRKDLPSVSLLQKTSSSPVTCHATGFYPDRVDLFWQKDGEELHEEVRGEILPNQDGSFQTSVDLDLTGVKGEDWSRYSCVFHLAGVEEGVVTPLDRDAVRSNRKLKTRTDEGFPTAALVGGLIAVLLAVAGCIVGIIVWKRRNDGFKQANTSENSSSSGDPAVKNESSEEQSMLKK